MLEKQIENYFVTNFKSLGWDSIKLIKNGYPDRMFLKNGQVFFIEFKSEKGKLSKQQSFSIQVFRQNGFSVFIVSSKTQFKNILELVTN